MIIEHKVVTNMSNNNFNVEDAFFVIDSDNLQTVTTKLYGFAIINSMLIEDSVDVSADALTGEGAYVFIERVNNNIFIKQDFTGSYGVYLFKEKNYFAISNSFIYLVDYLKAKKELSLNKAYADFFTVVDLCSVAYSETMVNEIELIDRCAEITIDIVKNDLTINFHDYHENTVDIDSKECIAILDNWFNKWTGVIRNLQNITGGVIYR